MTGDRQPVTVRDVAVLGMMTALLEASKRLLDNLPNVELITFLLIMFTLFYGRRVIAAALAFTLLEIAWWGVHVWVIMYLYVWPVLILITDRLHRGLRERGETPTPLPFALLAAVFGLLFGAMCSIPYLFIGGPVMMITWWIAGIPYDILHGVSNFLICLVLFKPVHKALRRSAALFVIAF